MTRYTHGESLSNEYAAWYTPFPKDDLSAEFKTLDISPFYTLSDCDQRITRGECSDLFKIMKKHEALLERSDVDEEFKASFSNLMLAFEVGANKGGVIFQ